jgi:Ca2+-binding RTX toxin-like protein
MPTLSPVRVTGDPANRVNVIFAGDGYHASQIETLYKTHIDNAVSYFFDGGPLSEPFTRYDGFFNIYRANIVSAESGADDPALGVFRDTALDASYGYDGRTQRLLYVNNVKTSDAVSAALAGTGVGADMVLVSVNETKYGGGGGQYAVYAGGNPSAYEIALHELGHSYAGLADEYTEYPDNTAWNGWEPGSPNLTMDPTGAKWSHWLGYEQPGIGEIGAYEGGNQYYELGIFRPSLISKMSALGFAFDAVAREQFILNFYEKVDPIDDHTPNENPIVDSDWIGVTLIDEDVIDVHWSVDGQTILDGNSTTFDLSDNGFGLGTFEVAAVAYDQTDWVRIHPELTHQRVQWTIAQPTGATTESEALTGTGLSDKIFALDGNDLVRGLDAGDTLDGGAGDDELHGGNGKDRLSGQAGSDELNGGGSRDTLDGGDDNDLLDGGSGRDRLSGGSGDDTQFGRGSKDRLDGGSGNDILDGGLGNDILHGGLGNDLLTGGSGFDRFSFDSVAECGLGPTRDVITDFLQSDNEKIDLTSIDANASVAGDQAFTFIGENSFTGAVAELHFSGGICRGDIDGDGRADFELQVLGPSSMQTTDFVL